MEAMWALATIKYKEESMVFDQDKLTWACHVCKKVRPDAAISVYSTQMERGGVKWQENVRYCNDNQDCIDGARNIKWAP